MSCFILFCVVLPGRGRGARRAELWPHSRMPQPAAAASAAQPPHVTSAPDNLVHSSAPGCHIAGKGSDPSSAWVLSRRRFSRRSLGLRKADAVPDISLEPQSKTLMFLNPSDGAKAFFVSVLHRCTARHGPLAAGASRDAQGQETPVTTLVVTVQPQQIVEVCTVQVRRPAVHARLQPRLQPRMPRLPTVAGGPGTRRAALLGHRRATRAPPTGCREHRVRPAHLTRALALAVPLTAVPRLNPNLP